MGTVNTVIPQSPAVQFLNPDGSINPVWLSFLNSISKTTNSANGFLNTANSPSNPQSQFFATPSDGPGIAAFRDIASADLGPIAGQYPATATNDNAGAGYIGEYASVSLDSAHAIALSGSTAADVLALSLSPGDWDVWGLIGTVLVSANMTILKAWLNTISVTDPNPPNGGAYFQFQSIITGAGVTQTTGPISASVGMMRLSIGQQTKVYLSADAVFTGTSVSAFGFIGARRAR